MADQKITQLNELTALAAGDYLVAVDDPGGSAETKFISVSNSYISTRGFVIALLDSLTAPTVVDGLGSFYFPIPAQLDGYNLVDADVVLTQASTDGTPTFQIYNVTQTVDMLTTEITVDETELTSYTAAAQPVIDATNDDVATGDQLRFDCDVAGTSTLGCTFILVFRIP